MGNAINKEVNLLASFSIVKKDAEITKEDEVIVISGYASYCGLDASGKSYVDLAGDVLCIDGVDLDVWASNPVILMNHNREKVVGKGLRIEKRADGLYLECEIYKNATDPQDWFRLSNNLISTFSVGFRTLDGTYKDMDGESVWFITKSLLLEVSCVGIPCNSMSKFTRTKALSETNFDLAEKVETPSQSTEDNIMTHIKVKRADLLTAKQVDEFKALGGDIEAEVEVSLSDFIKGIVAQELKAAQEKAAEEAAVKEAEEAASKEAAEVAAKEAADALVAEEAALAAAEEEKEAEVQITALKGLIDSLKAELTVEEK